VRERRNLRRKFQTLFEAVRKGSATDVWSRGVELTRAGAVIGQEAGDDEAVFRISTRGGMISFTVNLYLDDTDWDCSCPSREDVCEHITAAVIAMRRTAEGAVGLRSAEEAGRVEYRFERRAEGLALSRHIVRGGKSHPLEATLAAVASGRVDGPGFVAGQTDLAAELAMGTHRHGLVPSRLAPKLFPVLARCSGILLDGKPVEVGGEPVLPHARLVEQGDGYRLSLVDNPDSTELFDNGIALCGERLRPVGEARLSGREFHELLRGKYFPPSDVGLLVAEILPGLARRLPVDILTDRLPGTVEEPPRAEITTRSRRSVKATGCRCARSSSTAILPSPAWTAASSFTCKARPRCAIRRRSGGWRAGFSKSCTLSPACAPSSSARRRSGFARGSDRGQRKSAERRTSTSGLPRRSFHA